MKSITETPTRTIRYQCADCGAVVKDSDAHTQATTWDYENDHDRFWHLYNDEAPLTHWK